MKTAGFDDFFERLSSVSDINNQSNLAQLLGVGRAAVSLAKKKNKVPTRWIMELASMFDVDAKWLQTGQGVPGGSLVNDYCNVPKVVARLCAGGGSFETGSEVEGYYSFRQDWLSRKGKPEDMVLMDVMGNSMEPELREGDMVLVDQSQKSVLAGGIYAVGVEDTVMVKRIEKLPGRLVLLSDNPDYSPISLSGDELQSVRMIGRILWICREYM